MALQGRQSARMFGNDKLEASFRSMSRADRYAMVMRAYEVATKPLIDESKGNLVQNLKRRSRTMNLYQSLGFVKQPKGGNSNYVTAKVGARKYRPYKGFHGHLIDAGTATRSTRKGYNRGRMPATHFFTSAVESTEFKVSSEMISAMKAELEKEIREKFN